MCKKCITPASHHAQAWIASYFLHAHFIVCFLGVKQSLLQVLEGWGQTLGVVLQIFLKISSVLSIETEVLQRVKTIGDKQLTKRLITKIKRAFRAFLFKKFYCETMVKQLWQFKNIFSHQFDPLRSRYRKMIARYREMIAILFPLDEGETLSKHYQTKRKCIKTVPNNWLQLQLSRQWVRRYLLITVVNLYQKC